MKITDVGRKAYNQRNWKGVAGETEKIAEATMYLAYILPASSRAVLSERKMIRIFIRERETDIKRGKYIFHMQIRPERKSGNGLERFGKIRSTVVKIDRREAPSRNAVIHFRGQAHLRSAPLWTFNKYV